MLGGKHVRLLQQLDTGRVWEQTGQGLPGPVVTVTVATVWWVGVLLVSCLNCWGGGAAEHLAACDPLAMAWPCMRICALHNGWKALSTCGAAILLHKGPTGFLLQAAYRLCMPLTGLCAMLTVHPTCRKGTFGQPMLLQLLALSLSVNSRSYDCAPAQVLRTILCAHRRLFVLGRHSCCR
jgi:hypothetical protein